MDMCMCFVYQAAPSHGTVDSKVASSTKSCPNSYCTTWLAPKSGIDLYEMKGVSKLGESLMSLWGGQALCVGTYLAALILEKSQSEAFAYSMIMNGVAALKYALLEADDLKAPKTGPLAWAALSAGLAYKSLN